MLLENPLADNQGSIELPFWDIQEKNYSFNKTVEAVFLSNNHRSILYQLLVPERGCWQKIERNIVGLLECCLKTRKTPEHSVKDILYRQLKQNCTHFVEKRSKFFLGCPICGIHPINKLQCGIRTYALFSYNPYQKYTKVLFLQKWKSTRSYDHFQP